jgi:hypothetical protein
MPMTDGFGPDLDLAKASSPKVPLKPGWYANSLGRTDFRLDRKLTDQENLNNFLGGAEGKEITHIQRALTLLNFRLISINGDIRVYRHTTLGKIITSGLGRVQVSYESTA